MNANVGLTDRREEAGTVFERLRNWQNWIIDKIPAQRKMRDHGRRLQAESTRLVLRNFENLPAHKQRDLLENDTIAAFMRDNTKGDERRHADH